MTNPNRDLFANRGFLSIWLASVVSGLGDKIAIIALYLHVFHMTGRAVDLGLLAAAQLIPGILLGPVTGLILDRFDRRRVMILSELGSALVVAALPLADSMTKIYMLAALLAVGRQICGPARLALVPDLVPSEQLEKANGMAMVAQNVLLIVGPVIGALIVNLWGENWAYWIDSGTFLASAAILGAASLQYLPREAGDDREDRREGEGRPRRALRRIREGVCLMWSLRRIRFALIFLSAMTFVMAMQQPLVVLFIKGVLERSNLDLGLILSAAGIGGILGAFVGGLMRSSLRPLRTVTWLMALDGALLTVFALNRNFIAALALFGVFGAIGTIAQISLATFLQREAPEKHRGRIFGWLTSIIGPMSLASVFIGPMAAEVIGVIYVLCLSGLLELVIGLLGRMALGREPSVSQPESNN